MLGLSEARVLVAGAGQGIGRAIAKAAAAQGAVVLCVDVDEASARQVADEVVAEGGDALWFCADLRITNDIDAAVAQAIVALGGIDVFVDVLGRAVWGTLLELSDSDWDEAFAINVGQGFRLTQAVGREMVRQGTGGSIVHISSINALTGQSRNGACAAAKAALSSLVKTAALELGSAGVRVNAVAPGAVATPRLLASVDPDYWAEVEDSIPLGRAASVDDIASAALFLISNLSRYITGQTLVVDGGATAGFPLPGPKAVHAARANGAA